MKKVPVLLIISVLLSALLFTAGCSSSQTESANSSKTGDTINIGAVLDISGTSSSLGIPERDTLQMMADQLNAKGGINGKQVKMIIMDNKSDETESVLAVKKLIDNDKVVAVIGASASGTSLAMVDTVQKEGVPMISLATNSKIVQPVAEHKWVFKMAQSDATVADKMIIYAKAKGAQKIAVLYMNNAFGDGGKKALIESAAAKGIDVVFEDKFEATDKEMSAQLAKIKASEAQAVLVWAIPPSASILTRNYRDLGLKIPLIHCHGIANQKFLELADESANNIVLPVGKIVVAEQLPDSDPQKQVLLSYAKDYSERFKSQPNTFGGHAWDAFSMLVNVIKESGTDRVKIRDGLEKTTGFTGISGVFNMSAQDHNGLDEACMVMVEVKDGKWNLIK
ncbi:Extracellular ligand-binding receptor [Desulfofarcimen acetoxidans DSM 771]|jgi:branched-chain amino acid transport system substrate-binding protein|uniref:Extracellular ligand-binding receptor n=1 Tax=Desulfofarcimen acetoxidans (strain ATCC 49208 / DSM 771 / KCTC 5769 / VKM B-1644 / 5575) TaxID=485916 RepID=C8VXD0_DESAS|nr:ABC transporter substrate-binding protein [Desulfofarcimen acetoxidans]ACV64526.1 Extracellular ligand-binding receptor [Desulfofarcimen acetoxidans DSM 771]